MSRDPHRLPHPHLATWAALCLGLGAAFGAEGLHFALAEHELGGAAAIFNVGFFAPLLVVLAAALTVVVAAWRALGWLPDLQGLRRWTYDDEPLALADRTAGMTAAAVAVAVFFAASYLVGARVLGAVARPQNGLALTLGLQIGIFAVCVGVFGVAFLPLRALARRVARHAPRFVVAPVSFLAAGAVAAVVAAAIVASTDLGALLPWHVVTAAAAGIAGTAAAQIVARRRPIATAAGAAAILATCFALTVWMPDALRENRALLTSSSPLASAIYARLEPHLDLDGDGSLHVLGGRDCAARDPSSFPGALEVINNGIDEDCSGADLADTLQINEAAVSYGRPEQVEKKPHIFLITTDSLSMDRTSLGRSDRDTTPELAKLAAESVVLENSFALGPSTRLALPGLLAGVYNSMLPLQPNGGQPYDWASDAPTLAAHLGDAGYRTVQVMPDSYFSRRWKHGPSHGFDVRDASATRKPADRQHTAPEVTDAVIEQIQRAAKQDEPTFLWAHYYDHHSPFRQPKGGVVYGESTADVYDAELHFADRHWGRVFEALAETFEPDEYVIVFTSDHGEAFDEFHPKKHHGYDLRHPVVHVPLVIRAPHAPARRVPGLVTHADVAPTLADLAGAARHPAWVGESLTPVLYDDAHPRKNVAYAMFYIPERLRRGRDPFSLLSVRTGDLYYEADYEADTERLTRWRGKGASDEDILDSRPDDAAMLRHLAAAKLRELRTSERGLRGTKLDETKAVTVPAKAARPAIPTTEKKKRTPHEKRP